MTTNELMIAEILKDIGAMSQRLNTIECLIYNKSTASEDDSTTIDLDERYSHNFTYPVKAVGYEAETSHFRAIKSSTYKVTIAQPFSDPPAIVTVEMTRSELDDYIKRSPYDVGEWLVELTPSYKEFL